MSTKNTLNFSVSSDGGSAPITGSQQESGGTEINLNQNFAAGSTNAVLAVAFAYADLQSIALVSNKDMTIEFNNATTGVPTINLVAGCPFVWQKSPGYFANPFTANVTTAFVTCVAAATLKGKILVA